VILKNNVKIAFDLLSRNIKNTFLVILLQVCSILLIGLMLLEYNKGVHISTKLERIFKQPINKLETVKIDAGDIDEESLHAFTQEVRSMDELLAIGKSNDGFITTLAGADNKLLYDIQKKDTTPYTYTREGEVAYIITERSLMDAYNLEYIDKMDIPNEIPQGWYYVILGYEFREIPVGTEYVRERDGVTYKQIVAGVLKENQEFAFVEFDSWSEPQIINTDYQLLRVSSDSNFKRNFVYVVKEDNSVMDVRNKITVIAEKYGIDKSRLHFENAQSALETYNTYSKNIYGLLIELAVIVVIATVLISICIQSVEIIKERHMFGIMYANGACQKDFIKIMFIENVIKMIIAGIFSTGIVIMYYKIILTQGINYDVDIDIIFTKVIYEVILCAILIVVLSSIIPALIIKKNTPAKLIRNGD